MSASVLKGESKWYICAVLHVSKKTLTTEASTNKMDFAHTTRREEVSKYQSKNVSILDSNSLGPSLMVTTWLQLLLPFHLHSSRKKGKGQRVYQEDKNLPRNPQQRCLLTAHQPELWPLFPWCDSLSGMQFGSGNQQCLTRMGFWFVFLI